MSIDPGFLMNTLNGMSVQTPKDGLEEELLRAAAARTQQMTQEASSAQQQYQQQASAPPPQLGAMETFVPTLLSNIAAVLGRDPSYRDRNHQNLGQQRQALLQSRAQNLQSLRDIYAQKAEAAQRSGDMEATEKFKLQQEKMSKLQEQILETMKGGMQQLKYQEDRKHDFDLEAFKAANRLKEAMVRKAPGGADGYQPDEIQAVVDDLAEGRVGIQQVPVEKGFRRVVMTELRAQGKRIIPPKVREAVNEIGAARKIIDELATLSAQVNTGPAGPGRFLTGAQRKAGAVMQTDPAASLFESLAGAFAGNLARSVGAERGVLTDQDRKWAMDNLPKMSDTKEVADAKLSRVGRFLDSKAENAMKAFTTVGAGVGQAAEPVKGTIMLMGPKGQKREYDANDPEVKEALSHGWKRTRRE